MNDTKEVGTLLVFVVLLGEEGFEFDAQYLGKGQQGFHAGSVGAGFEATDGLGVKTGFLAKFSLSEPGYLAVTSDGRTQT
ncbi:hypothetical protein D3C79_989960 [compost metagenome]